MEEIKKIKEYIIGALATIGCDAKLSDSDKLKQVDDLLMECLENVIDPYLGEPETKEIFKSRGCCSECGEGYDNEEEWLYNTKCALCGHPIPEHLIVKRP